MFSLLEFSGIVQTHLPRRHAAVRIGQAVGALATEGILLVQALLPLAVHVTECTLPKRAKVHQNTTRGGVD